MRMKKPVVLWADVYDANCTPPTLATTRGLARSAGFLYVQMDHEILRSVNGKFVCDKRDVFVRPPDPMTRAAKGE
jgi:hypothetical protein